MSQGLIHHIELYVSDLEKTVHFWGWFLEDLGYSPFQKWDKGQSWKIDETYLVFVQVEEEYIDKGYHRRRIGLNHLAFHARSRAHVDTVTDKLIEEGLTILYADEHPFAGGADYYAVYFEDPDRIKVELVAPKE